MPKTVMLRSPYRLSMLSPMGEPQGGRHFRRSTPSTPSPLSRDRPRGLLHAVSNAARPVVVKHEDSNIDVSGLLNVKQEHEIDAARASTSHINDGAMGLDSVQVRHGSRVRHVPRRITENSIPSIIRVPHGPLPLTRRSSSIDLKAKVTLARRRLRRAHHDIEELKERVQRLESSEKKLKAQVVKEKEIVKDTKVEVEESLTELLRAEERLDEMEASVTTLRRDFNRYRGWWLTENRSLKVALKAVPKRKWDAGLEAIAASSYSRFMAYSGSGSN